MNVRYNKKGGEVEEEQKIIKNEQTRKKMKTSQNNLKSENDKIKNHIK